MKLLNPEDLRAYQWKCIKFCLGLEGSGLFVEPGLGKSVSGLSAIKALKHQKLVTKPALIVAPLRVIYNVWRQEAVKWSHVRSLRFSVIHGSVNRRKAALVYPADIYLINPEGLLWFVKMMMEQAKGDTKIEKIKYLQSIWPFDTLLIDESTKFKSHNSARFKELRNVLGLFKRRIILTGTPIPNSYLELWAQIFILDGGQRLGKSFHVYRERFFEVDDYMGFSYKLREGAAEKIASLISDIVLTLKAEDYLDLPPDLPPQEVYVDLPAKISALYEKFEKEMFLELEKGDVEALNAATLSQRCHQIANGAIYSIDRETNKRDWELLHSEKIEALKELIAEIGQPVLVVYHFKHDLAQLKHAFPDAPNIGSGTKDLTSIIQEFQQGKHPCLFIHPQSAAHGVDGLQHGCRHIIFYSMIWSAENYMQVIERIGRARRQGMKEPTVVHLIMAKNTVDVAIRLSNIKKTNTQEGFRESLEEYRRMKEKSLGEIN